MRAPPSLPLAWQSPNRASGLRPLKQIPEDVYRDIFFWLRPAVRQDMDQNSYVNTLRVLSVVCRYFAYYVAHEVPRCQEFQGVSESPVAWVQRGPCYTAIIERKQPWEAMRTLIEECTVSRWFHGVGADHRGSFEGSAQEAGNFVRKLPLVLSRLDNLRALTLLQTAISYGLLLTLSRLGNLHQLVISKCFTNGVSYHDHSLFGIPGTPFPAMRSLTITGTDPRMITMFRAALVALGSAPALRFVAITDSNWLAFLLPSLSPNLVSLTGNFSLVGGSSFLQFVKGHAALEHLTMYYQKSELLSVKGEYTTGMPEIRWNNRGLHLISPFPSNGQHLDAKDLPVLRSFSGPFRLAPEIIRGRPVSKLALGSHLEPINPDHPFLRGLTVFPQTCAATTHPLDHATWITADGEIWKELKTIGGSIQELFLRFHVEMSPSVIASCFPNLVKLQLNLLISMGGVDYTTNSRIQNHFFSSLGEMLQDLTHLKSLVLYASSYPLLYRTSPGDQHDVVHNMFYKNCPTLETVVFGPLTVWHLRSPLLQCGECPCDLELISEGALVEEIRVLAREPRSCRSVFGPDVVRDWKGKIAGVLGEGPSGLGNEDVRSILMP